jgi:hypothetical protein
LASVSDRAGIARCRPLAARMTSCAHWSLTWASETSVGMGTIIDETWFPYFCSLVRTGTGTMATRGWTR